MPDIKIGFKEFDELAKEIVRENRNLRFRAQGYSMLPWIKNGTTLLVQPVQPQEIKRGDILLCCLSTGKEVAHRVIKIKKMAGQYKFTIQGDAFNNPDGIVDASQVRGRIVALEKPGQPLHRITSLERVLGLFWLFLKPLRRWVRRILPSP